MNEYMRIWYSSPSTYEYDETRDLYEQINEIINNKLLWYDALLHAEFYAYDNWKDLSIDLRYAKITTIVDPMISRDIAETDDARETFKRITWHIPYFIWRDPNKGNVIREYNVDKYKIEDIYNDCKQILLKREWNDDTVFWYVGNTKDEKLSINVNKKQTTVECETPFTFEYINFDFVHDINKLSMDDKNLMIAKIYFNGNTIIDASYLFTNCTSLQYVDVSNFNMNYCDDLSAMFKNCIYLQKIDFSNLDLDVHDPLITDMFINCLRLHTVIVKNCSTSTVDQLKCAMKSCGLDINNINFVS